MKKLLAAVTSVAMSTSLMSSAFASSLIVSAAGSVTVEQPNVSMGDMLDGAVKKTAQADFVVTPEEISVKPGETIDLPIYADPGSHKVAQLIVELKDSGEKLRAHPGDGGSHRMALLSEHVKEPYRTWLELRVRNSELVLALLNEAA